MKKKLYLQKTKQAKEIAYQQLHMVRPNQQPLRLLQHSRLNTASPLQGLGTTH